MLNIKKTFEDIRAQYQEERESFNCLLIGDAGSGKTYSLRTCRKPVLIYQFDPGGSQSISDLVQNEEEKIYVIDYAQGENPSDPSAFRKWERDFATHRKEGLFDAVGTVVIDSITTWGDALLAAILKANGRAPKEEKVNLFHKSGQIVAIPELRDYQIQMQTMGQYLGALTGLAPDFIAIGHIEKVKNEVTGGMISAPMVTGKLSVKLPILFDEIYIAEAINKSGGTTYHFLTAPSGIHRPRSRMSQGGLLDDKEEPNFKNILKKAGKPYNDIEVTTDA